jgi:hypothetical protein
VVNKNPKIDRELVKNYMALERKLKDLGVDTKPKFNIEPPLSSKITTSTT